MHTYRDAYLHICLLTYLPTRLLTCLLSYQLTNLPTNYSSPHTLAPVSLKPTLSFLFFFPGVRVPFVLLSVLLYVILFSAASSLFYISLSRSRHALSLSLIAKGL